MGVLVFILAQKTVDPQSARYEAAVVSDADIFVPDGDSGPGDVFQKLFHPAYFGPCIVCVVCTPSVSVAYTFLNAFP